MAKAILNRQRCRRVVQNVHVRAQMLGNGKMSANTQEKR